MKFYEIYTLSKYETELCYGRFIHIYHTYKAAYQMREKLLKTGQYSSVVIVERTA